MTFAGAITLIGSKLLAFVPLRLIAAVSGPLSTLGWWLAKSRRRVALTNLRLCFPEKSDAEREAIEVAARALAGVRGVDNRLVIRPELADER